MSAAEDVLQDVCVRSKRVAQSFEKGNFKGDRVYFTYKLSFGTCKNSLFVIVEFASTSEHLF